MGDGRGLSSWAPLRRSCGKDSKLHAAWLLSPAVTTALALAAVLAPAAGRAAGLTLADAIRAAWAEHPGLAAGAAQARAMRAEAVAAGTARLPSLSLSARAVVTEEPMAAFGLRLDQQRITAGDFDPARLNAPDPIGGVGLSATLTQPIYAGGRIEAARRAAVVGAEAEELGQARRRDELALAVVQGYLGAQAAREGVRFADDALRSASETERTVRAHNAQGLVLDADLARAVASRAGAEAERAAAEQRLASARSALALLVGEELGSSELVTGLEEGGWREGTEPERTARALAAGAGPLKGGDAPGAGGVGIAQRVDLRAARLRVEAAEAGGVVARAGLLPQVMAQVSAETMRSAPDQGATWLSAALVARWDLSFGAEHSRRAADERAAAAGSALRWEERRAQREVVEAERAVKTAWARMASAREAVAASEVARTQRQARHRQGLTPLSDVLEAEAGLAGARALWLGSLYQSRVASAELALAMGEPVEGVEQ